MSTPKTITPSSITPSGVCHVIDTGLASELGIVEALLINHFKYWINFNARAKKNTHQGRTWTFQTLDDLCNHFFYISKSQIFDAITMLCTGKKRKGKDKNSAFQPILMKGNFNKSKYDRTVWYAFVDEDLWVSKDTNSKENSKANSQENHNTNDQENNTAILEIQKMENWELQNDNLQFPTCYKDQDNTPCNEEVDKTKQTKEKAKVVASSSVVCDFLILGDKYKKVRLKTEQLEKLNKDLGEARTKFWIQELDLYLESTGKKYKNHEATIFNWAQRQASKQTLQEKYPHIGAHRLNSKLCFEKDDPPSGWKPKHIDVSGFLPDFDSSPPVGA